MANRGGYFKCGEVSTMLCQPDQANLASRARIAAWVRSTTCSLLKMLDA